MKAQTFVLHRDQLNGTDGICQSLFCSLGEKSQLLATYLDHSIPTDSDPSDTWPPSSPISSESTESYPGSSVSRSPKENDELERNVSSPFELVAASPGPANLDHPSLLCSLVTSSSHESRQPTCNILDYSILSGTSNNIFSSNGVCQHTERYDISSVIQYSDDCLLTTSLQEADDSTIPTAHSPVRPVSLSLRDKVVHLAADDRSRATEVQESNSTPTSTNMLTTSPGLEQQLSGADLAWMCTLDNMNISLEEVDLILSPTQCLSTIDDTTQLNTDSPHLGEERDCTWTTDCQLLFSDASAMELIQPNQHEALGSTNESNALVQLSDSEPQQNTSRLSSGSFIGPEEPSISVEPLSTEFAAADSESTLTCSETEFYENQLLQSSQQKSRIRRRRRRTSKRRRVLHLYSSSHSEVCPNGDETDDDNEALMSCPVDHLRRPLSTRNSSDTYISTIRHTSYRRIQNAQADADLKPWWPKNISITGNLGGLTHSASYHCAPPVQPSSDDDCAPKCENSIDVGHSAKPATKFKCRPEQSNVRNETAIHQWPLRRRRKQLELWQFILCRLETACKSSFQWVNRTSGVFRIVDTHGGAREWGRYRNNNRMDYEKMARAMRFYYKDSILRKARQQLHFQFAMPYVEWANKCYRRQ